MQKTISFIESELEGLYPPNEIRSFTHRIIEYLFHQEKQFFLLDKDKQLSPIERVRAEEIVTELKKFRPIQYILGETEFYGLKFKVNENVLIPRPETEELVDLVINDILQLAQNYKSPSLPLSILDIGTGSGCIAISLAKKFNSVLVSGIDVSEAALETAKLNASINNVSVNFVQADILKDQLSMQYDIIVSNPPYITPKEKKEMSKNVLDYEPHEALFVPEKQPLLFYERIADIGKEHLESNGKLYFETSSLYGRETALMLENKGYKNILLLKDISGKDRMIKAEI